MLRGSGHTLQLDAMVFALCSLAIHSWLHCKTSRKHALYYTAVVQVVSFTASLKGERQFEEVHTSLQTLTD